MLYQLQRHLQGYQSWAQVHLWSPHSSELHQNLLCSPAFMKGRQCLSLPTEEHIRNLVSWAFFDSSNSAPLVSSSSLSISVLDSSVGVPSVPIAVSQSLYKLSQETSHRSYMRILSSLQLCDQLLLQGVLISNFLLSKARLPTSKGWARLEWILRKYSQRKWVQLQHSCKKQLLRTGSSRQTKW